MSLDLPHIPRTEPPTEGDESHPVSVLPPPDRGLAAWKFLFACFIIEGVLWGFPMAYGVFQEHYSQQSEFADSSNIAVVGTVSTSIYFLGAPLATPFVKQFPHWRHHMVLLGSAICVLSLLAASFASSVAVLIATQGVLYGLGFLVIYFPLLSMLNEWFIQRRAFAYAVVYSGGGFSGIGLPFLSEWLLSRYGFRTTLRVFVVAQTVLLIPILPLCKGRLSTSHQIPTQRIDLAFVKHPLFWVLAASNLSQSFAYYIPSLYLPTFASSMGLSGSIGALVLAALNLATVLGQLGFGYLVDRLSNIFTLIVVTGVTSSVATFTLWGLTRSLAPLLVFSFVYGLFAGAYVVFWPRFGSMLADDPQPVFSWMAFGKGLGNILTAPIAESLLGESMGLSYGLGKFAPLVIYLGALMFVSSLGGLGWFASSRESGRGETR
ncbi:MFS general substrate transporter [Aspergillus steynii IBT 23096]|uniref:MFS general substrate transporter n=1 Tax=Aspergillus steynii IBT 23096 TaxID=1392250 RepID=A0A2I2FZF3_9EURO|nr:MFS general substrate transporter [Aspergillus steynii IBT 23096]PLB46008.1 MFS general substrate transporter [Aspergillus steynii IBT 23096]